MEKGPAQGFPPSIEELASLSEGELLGLLGSAAEPLEAILDLLIRALGARYAICADLESRGGRRAVGLSSSGMPIRQPEALIRDDLSEALRRDRRPLLLGMDPALREGWCLAWPLPSKGPLAAVFAEGEAPDLLKSRSILEAAMSRLASWISHAWEIAELRRGTGLPLASEGRRAGKAPAAEPEIPSPPEPTQRGAPGSSRDGNFHGIIAFSPALREILRTVALIACSDAAVLIEGESGTGKELIARAIHRLSARARGPFVSESCAACPEGLLESEFFGVERGAYTGACSAKPGLFERAQGGTLFLDEIGEMDLGLQRKLLRVLQEREVRRVGGGKMIPVDFRLVSATNRILSEEALAGRFRPDLLYRLDVVRLRLPPLRERPEDIPHLIRHFLDRHSRSAGAPLPRMDPAALRLLCEYRWPGNVRELENEMWRAVALRLEAITPANMSGKIVQEAQKSSRLESLAFEAGRSLEEIERDLLGGLIREALRKTYGNKIRAAQLLRIPKTNLYRRLRRYGISVPRTSRKRKGLIEAEGSPPGCSSQVSPSDPGNPSPEENLGRESISG